MLCLFHFVLRGGLHIKHYAYDNLSFTYMLYLSFLWACYVLQWIAIMSHSLIYSFFLSNKAAFMFLMKDWTGLYCKERSHFISNLYLYSHFISLKIILRLKPFKYSLLQDQNVTEEYLEMGDLPKKTGTWSISASPGLFAFSLHPAHKVFWLFVSKLPCPVFYHRGQVHKTL